MMPQPQRPSKIIIWIISTWPTLLGLALGENNKTFQQNLSCFLPIFQVQKIQNPAGT